ncbi:MAG: hypothetical protein ACRDKW_04830 [Actinomycetota bacterium]
MSRVGGRDKERVVRAAVEHLLSARDGGSDGMLTVSRLAAEAGVARQELYRSYRGLVEEFRDRVARRQERGVPFAPRASEFARLREQLDEATPRAARYRTERDGARQERDALASRLVYLDEQNRLLRRELEARSRVRSIDPP